MKPLLSLAVLLVTSTLAMADAPTSKVTPLVTQDFTTIPGKQGLMLLIEFPPGGSDPIHHHNSEVFVYVLEGSIVMQVKGGKEVTLGRGDVFTEKPTDVHVVGRNASATEPAKFVVFMVLDKGAPPVIPGDKP